MALNSIISESSRYYPFLSYQFGAVGWGLLIITFIVLTLFLIVKRKRKTKHVSVLIYQNRQQMRQGTTEQWEKAKTHIEKLLYEMTENSQTHEPLNPHPLELFANNKHCFENSKNGKSRTVAGQNPVDTDQLIKSKTPLDVQELHDVATLAKRLRSRNRQKVGN